MRKHIVIGAIAVMVIGVAAYVFLQPRTPEYWRLSAQERVEWHKAKYMKCVNRMWGNTLWARTERLAKRVVGLPPPTTPHPRAETQARSHLSALVALGYLTERRYVITNQTVQDVLARTYRQRRFLGKKYMPLHLTERVQGADQFAIIALPEVAVQYDDLIREADGPGPE